MKPSYIGFEPKTYKWRSDIDYRKNPHLYEIGRGQQGVLVCEPYKSELHRLWKFKTEEVAKLSAKRIWAQFLDYLGEDDFVGADMAKKYLHMGFTRSRRYANHKSGKKWIREGSEWKVLPQEGDWDTSEKAKSAKVFYEYWVKARENKEYLKLKEIFIKNKQNERVDS
jgi:hypothetical protein